MGRVLPIAVNFITQPLMRAVTVPLLLACNGSMLISYFPGGTAFFIVVGTAAIVFAWWMAELVCSAIYSRSWKVAALRFLLLALSVPLAVVAFFLSGDPIHFVTSYPYYLYRIVRTSERPVKFYWGDAAMTAIEPMRMRTLIYDDRGAIREAVGNDRPGQEGSRIITIHVAGNFFMEIEYAP